MKTASGNIIELLKRMYRVTAIHSGEDVRLRFEGLSEEFILSPTQDEFTLFADCWYEHFSSGDQLFEFLDGLFSGKMRVVVKYRGKTPVGHQIQEIADGGVRVISQTSNLVPLFWRRKSFKTLRYVTSCSTAERDKVTDDVAVVFKHDPLKPLFPEGWPDRILALTVILVILIFGVGLAMAGLGWNAEAVPDLMAKYGLLFGGISVVFVCLLEATWLLFRPAWAERLVRRLAIMLVLPFGFSLLAIMVYSVYYGLIV